jgi:hypothetical protein
MDARPDRGDDRTIVDDVVVVVLRGRGAGVIGKNAQYRADRQVRWRFDAGAMGDNAVLLIGIDHNQARDRIAREIADNAIALIHGEPCGAAIARHGHPAGIDQDPALVVLVADHACENRDRNVVERADPETRHHQIEEHEDPGAHFGHAGKVVGKMRSWR